LRCPLGTRLHSRLFGVRRQRPGSVERRNSVRRWQRRRRHDGRRQHVFRRKHLGRWYERGRHEQLRWSRGRNRRRQRNGRRDFERRGPRNWWWDFERRGPRNWWWDFERRPRRNWWCHGWLDRNRRLERRRRWRVGRRRSLQHTLWRGARLSSVRRDGDHLRVPVRHDDSGNVSNDLPDACGRLCQCDQRQPGIVHRRRDSNVHDAVHRRDLPMLEALETGYGFWTRTCTVTSRAGGPAFFGSR
jgi:hypothetical protein